jgi:hypothetical protein
LGRLPTGLFTIVTVLAGTGFGRLDKSSSCCLFSSSLLLSLDITGKSAFRLSITIDIFSLLGVEYKTGEAYKDADCNCVEADFVMLWASLANSALFGGEATFGQLYEGGA